MTVQVLEKLWPGAHKARVLYKESRKEGGEELCWKAKLCGKWFDKKMRHTTAKAKKETGGLAGGPNDRLAEQ